MLNRGEDRHVGMTGVRGESLLGREDELGLRERGSLFLLAQGIIINRLGGRHKLGIVSDGLGLSPGAAAAAAFALHANPYATSNTAAHSNKG